MIESLSRGTTTAKKTHFIAVYKACLIISVPFIWACVLSVSFLILSRFCGILFANPPPTTSPRSSNVSPTFVPFDNEPVYIVWFFPFLPFFFIFLKDILFPFVNSVALICPTIFWTLFCEIHSSERKPTSVVISSFTLVNYVHSMWTSTKSCSKGHYFSLITLRYNFFGIPVSASLRGAIG